MMLQTMFLSAQANLAPLLGHFVNTLVSIDIMIQKPGGHSHVHSKQDGLSKKTGALKMINKNEKMRWRGQKRDQKNYCRLQWEERREGEGRGLKSYRTALSFMSNAGD
ncbi:hypothetical protein GOODEAATRI_014381 [Goodea atripinnis]|uniref:Uncharacterized protein n=1 Tax=Goodea atripinnis TaxID=208336 RepID=A0ABV0P487_9TELE